MTEPAASVAGKRKYKHCRWLLLGVLLLAFIPLAGTAFLLGTESGLQFLIRAADQLAGPYFSAEQAQGRLIDSWQISKLRIQIKNAVDIRMDKLAWSWQPLDLFRSRELHVKQLAAQGLVISIFKSEKKQGTEQPHKHITLPEIRLPLGLSLRVDELQVAESKIVAPSGNDALLIHEVLAQASIRNDQADITRLKADTSQFGCDLHGKIRFSGAWPMQAEGGWQVPDHGINELRGMVKVQGDFDKATVSATMVSPAQVTLKGEATDILNELHWQAAAETGHFHLHDIKVNVPVDGNLSIISAAGTVKSYGGVLAADIHYEGYPPMQAEAKVEAMDYSGLKIDYLTLRHEASELTLRGAMRWQGGFSWQAELAGKELDPALAAADWPGAISGMLRSNGYLAAGRQELEVNLDGIRGELRGQPFQLDGRLALADKKLKIDELTLASGPANARISGTADAAQNIDLAVQAEVKDLAAFVPNAGGSVRLEGTAVGAAENPAVKLTLNGSQLAWQEQRLASLAISADAALDKNKSTLLIHDFHALADGKTALALKGQLGWSNGLSWQAELKAAELDPGLLAPDWPGAINAELRSQGSKTADNLTAEVQIDTLAGKLRGFPLKGSGTVKLAGKAVAVADLRLQSGSTFVQADGRADFDKELALTFKTGSDDLSSLVPDAGGSFKAEGEISGNLQQPGLRLQASGSKLRFQDYGLKDLQATIKADLSPSGQVDGEINAAGIQIKAKKINSAQLRLKGGTEQHQLEFAAASDLGKLRLAAAGAWQEQHWQGQLRELELNNKQFGQWKTEKAADLTLSADRCTLADFVLTQDKVRAAVSGQWEKAAGWQAQTTIEHLALALAKKWQLPVPENFPEMAGELNIAATAQGQAARPQQAELTVDLPKFALTAQDYESDAENGTTTWQWQDNQIKAKLRDDVLQVTAKSKFQDKSTASLTAELRNCGDFTQLDQMPLSGQFKVKVTDISPMTQLSGYMVQGQGGFGGDIALHGTVLHPRMDGVLTLKKGRSGEGKIHIPAAGINLRDLRLAVAGDGSHNQLDLTARSGQGQLRAQGTISRNLKLKEPQIEAEFSITGENFQAADLPEYQVSVSPELWLVHNRGGTLLAGKIAVPKARIAPLGFSGAAASSKDVVVIDSDTPSPKHSLPFSAAVTLELGKEVAVDAFGIKGFLDGGLTVNAKADQPVTALGSLYLRDTSVAFEGVALQLNEGRIFYQGGPIDNPGLDIRASRTVNKIEAGIHLTGSADDMNIKLFSDTPMEDSAILSWLLSGQNGVSASRSGDAALSPAAAALSKIGGGALLKSVNPLQVLDMEDFVDVSIGGGKEASDVSLVMSKEIYKDLYISYGKDLTGEGGSFRARYDLGHGFSVESETSSNTAGADLLWSLER